MGMESERGSKMGQTNSLVLPAGCDGQEDRTPQSLFTEAALPCMACGKTHLAFAFFALVF